MLEKDKDSIQVMVRVRPLNERERNEGAKSCISFNEEVPNSLILDSRPDPKNFYFDFVGGEKTTQEDIFRIVGKTLTTACLEGYNACIFAYGQTGAGKTFTMQGRGLDEEGENSVHRGLQPRVFDYLYAKINQEKKCNPNMEYFVKCSYLEIYNEQIMDLLWNTSNNLNVREDFKKGVYVEGLTEESSKSAKEMIDLLKRGARNRHVGSTNMNFESSRSHSVFSLTIESRKSLNGMINVKYSKLHFVDLAGSERQKQTAAAGDRLKEAGNINKSLTVLGCVINSLVETSQGKSRHIPYRDSKLTFILKDSLGGNSRTFMIAAVSAASTSFQETLSTLKFAQRAKMIRNKASINEESSGNLESLKKEIRRLKDELAQARNLITNLENQLGTGLPKLPPDHIYSSAAKNKDGSKMEEEDIHPAPVRTTGKKSEIKCMKCRCSSSSSAMAIEPSTKDLEDIKLFIDNSVRAIELDTKLLEELEGMKRIQVFYEAQISKTIEDLKDLRNWIEIFQTNEKNYRTIIALLQAKLLRLENSASLGVERNDNEIEKIIKEKEEENEALRKMLSQLPLLGDLVAENASLRLELAETGSREDIKEKIEAELKENILLINAMEESIQTGAFERKEILEKVDKYGLQKLPTPEKVKKVEESLQRIKKEHNDKLEKINFEMLELKQKELEQERAVELERKRYLELHKDLDILKHEKNSERDKYERRISELVHNMEEKLNLQKSKATSEYDQKSIEMNKRLLEFENKYSSLKQKLEETMSKLAASDSALIQEQKEREKIQQELNKIFSQSQKEKNIWESTVFSLENKNNELNSQVLSLREELTTLAREISEKEREDKQYLESLENGLEEMRKNIEKLEKEVADKAGEIAKLEGQLEGERERNSSLENEKKRISEDLDILTQTYNYQVEELEDKRRETAELSLQLKEKERQGRELQEKVDVLDNNSNQLREQLFYTETDQNSSLNQALLDNYALKEQLSLLRNELERSKQMNINIEVDLRNLQIKNDEVLKSEEHFRSAYLDLKRELQEVLQKNKGLQEALSNKEMEQQDFQHDLSRSNEVVNTLQERIADLINELKRQKEFSNKLDKEYKITKEKILYLQDNLSAKMDELQKISAEKADLTKMMRQLNYEKDVMRNQGQILEKKFNDLCGIYQQTQKDLKDLQVMVNVKMEENVSLNNNCKILQGKLNTSVKEDKRKHLKEIDSLIKIRDVQKENMDGMKERIDKLVEMVAQKEKEQLYEQEFFEKKFQELTKINKSLEQKKNELKAMVDGQIKAVTEMKEKKEDERKEIYRLNNIILEMQERFKSMITEKEKISSSLLSREVERGKSLYDENVKIKRELELKTEIVRSVEVQYKDRCVGLEEKTRQQEQSLNKMQEEYQNILSAAKKRENQISKMKDEIHELRCERDSLYNELRNFKNIEMKFKKEASEMLEETGSLKSENVRMIQELSEWNKMNDVLWGGKQLSVNEKIKYVISLKEDLNRSTEEKNRVIDKLNKSTSSIESNKQVTYEENKKLRQDFENMTSEYTKVTNCIMNLGKMIYDNENKSLTKNLPNPTNGFPCDIITKATQFLLNFIKEKDLALRKISEQLEEKDVKFSLLEKELTNLKKKSTQSTASSNYSFSPMKSIKSKQQSGKKSARKSPVRSPSKSPKRSPSKSSLNSPVQKSSILFNFQPNSRSILNDRTNTNVKHRHFSQELTAILPGELTKKKMKIN